MLLTKNGYCIANEAASYPPNLLTLMVISGGGGRPALGKSLCNDNWRAR
jgi:hypothetical protein